MSSLISDGSNLVEPSKQNCLMKPKFSDLDLAFVWEKSMCLLGARLIQKHGNDGVTYVSCGDDIELYMDRGAR